MYVLYPEIIFQYLYKGVLEISTSSMDRLTNVKQITDAMHGQIVKKCRRYFRILTYNAPWFIYHDELAFLVMQKDPDWSRRYWRFMSVHDIPAAFMMHEYSV